MRRTVLLLLMLVLCTPACTCVESDVVESIDVLRDNTHSLSENYQALLDRSGPAPLERNPEWTDEEFAEAEALAQSEWEDHVEHQLMLMGANNTLADRIYTWAVAKSDPQEEEETSP